MKRLAGKSTVVIGAASGIGSASSMLFAVAEMMPGRARARGTHNKIGQLNPLRRYGVPEEIAYAALFLASGEAPCVNDRRCP